MQLSTFANSGTIPRHVLLPARLSETVVMVVSHTPGHSGDNVSQVLLTAQVPSCSVYSIDASYLQYT